MVQPGQKQVKGPLLGTGPLPSWSSLPAGTPGGHRLGSSQDLSRATLSFLTVLAVAAQEEGPAQEYCGPLSTCTLGLAALGGPCT